MDLHELKKEQLKLAPRIILKDSFIKPKTIGAVDCVLVGSKLLACVVVCDFPSFEVKEKKTFVLPDPLPYKPGFAAYRELPAIVEAFNMLEEEPDLLLIKGHGIIHPRKFGIAAHLGLVLNLPTIGVTEKLLIGTVEKGKVFLKDEIAGFEIKTKEHANPLYVSPGHQVAIGTVLNLIPKMIKYPHKLPEPLHLAHKIAKKKAKKLEE